MSFGSTLNHMDSKSSVFIQNICSEYATQHAVPTEKYEKYGVKRGLRNSDGTGVMAGITQIGNVKGYYMQDGEKLPAPGQLIYRGYNVEDLIHGFMSEGRFGYEETAYLLLFGKLPTASELEGFNHYLSMHRELPPGFIVDMMMKAPSRNIMNKLARSILALYSYYDDSCEDTSLENEMATAVNLLAKMPIIMVNAYQVKRKHSKISYYAHYIREF